VLCGEPFLVPESITKEHLIPRAFASRLHDNVAPSHYSCNNFRGVRSVVDTMILLEKKKTKMGEQRFKNWIGKKARG